MPPGAQFLAQYVAQNIGPLGLIGRNPLGIIGDLAGVRGIGPGGQMMPGLLSGLLG